MLAGLSESSLQTWSLGLLLLGIAGALGLIVALAGMHAISLEIVNRAEKKTVMVAPADITGHQTPAVIHVKAEEPPPRAVSAPPAPAAREITEEQRNAFVRELTDAPKRPTQVFIYDQDPEIKAYADQIRVMLILAGYNCGETVRTSASSSFSPTGVLIVVKDPKRAPAFAGAIQNGLHVVGIEALGAKDGELGEKEAVVVVGRRSN